MASENYTINGIDVSRYQWDLDWKQVGQPITQLPGPVQFAYVKATEGVGYVDPNAQSNATGAKAAGLMLGYYHFATLNNRIDPAGDAKNEAQAFLAAFKTLPGANLPPVLDIESNISGLTPAQVLQWVQSFFATLKDGGISNYMIYSYTPFLNANLPANHGLGNIPLWIAAYVNEPAPVLPQGWNTYEIWQYSAQGQFKGKDGKNVTVDLNRAKDSFIL